MDQFRIRQFDIIPNNILDVPITVVGAGAIGSATVISLAKVGFRKITVYDFDVVSDENMSNQFYAISQIGNSKVTALQKMTQSLAGISIQPMNMKYDFPLTPNSIVICAVDCMTVRKEIFEHHRDTICRFFIDTRMGAEELQIHALSLTDKKRANSYAKSLYSNDDSVEVACTSKATMYTPLLCAGLVTKIVKDFMLELPYTKSISWNINQNSMVSFLSTKDKK